MYARWVPALAIVTVTACHASHEEGWDLIECEPRSSPPHLFHADEPYPRGRIHACESALRADEEVVVRAVELGCRMPSRDGWAVDGACDYALALRAWSSLREAASCDELAELAASDPCTRPDADRYWRELGD